MTREVILNYFGFTKTHTIGIFKNNPNAIPSTITINLCPHYDAQYNPNLNPNESVEFKEITFHFQGKTQFGKPLYNALNY